MSKYRLNYSVLSLDYQSYSQLLLSGLRVFVYLHFLTLKCPFPFSCKVGVQFFCNETCAAVNNLKIGRFLRCLYKGCKMRASFLRKKIVDMGALWKGAYWMLYQGGKKNKKQKTFCDSFYTVPIWKARWITLCWAPPVGFMSVYTFTRCIVDPDQTYQASHLTEIVDHNRGILHLHSEMQSCIPFWGSTPADLQRTTL